MGTLSVQCVLYWIEISDSCSQTRGNEKKNMSAISCTKLLLSHHEMYSIVEKAVYKDLDKNKPAILYCPRYLARVSDRQTDRQTDKQAARQTDRQIETETEESLKLVSSFQLSLWVCMGVRFRE